MLYKISDNLYYSKHRYMYLEPSIGYIKGKNYSITIDSGNCEEQVEKFYKDLRDNNLSAPSFTILTHYHWDHSFGASYMDTKLITSKATSNHLKSLKERDLKLDNIQNLVDEGIDIQFNIDMMKKVYHKSKNDIKIKLPDIVKECDFSLNLGGIIVDFYNNDNSHSDDSLLIYVRKDKILFIGDSHTKCYMTQPMSFNKKKLRDYIDFIYKIDFKYAIPGHGNIYSKSDLINELEIEYNKILEE